MKFKCVGMFTLLLFVFAMATPSMAKDSKSSDEKGCACLAGTVPFKVGQAGIYINLPSVIKGRYAVSVQPTNTAGYSPTDQCTYFNVLKKTATNFQVQHKRCKDGVPVALDSNISLDWIAVKH